MKIMNGKENFNFESTWIAPNDFFKLLYNSFKFIYLLELNSINSNVLKKDKIKKPFIFVQNCQKNIFSFLI